MEMHQIRYFLAVCQTLNFTRAAEQCSVAQPSLTRAIQKLEEELGGPLFHRERNHTHLTALGRLVQPYLEQAYATTSQAKTEAENFGRGGKEPLTIGVMCTIGPRRLVPLMNKLRERLPLVDVRLRERNGRELLNDLVEGSLEIALIGLPTYPDRVRFERLYAERYVVAFPPGHRFESLAAVPVGEMNGEDYLRRVNCEYPEYYSDRIGDWTYQLNVRYESEREDWIQAMVLAGMGCSLIPEYMPLFPGIRTRVVVDPELSRDIGIATVPGRRFSPGVDTLVRIARSHDWNHLA